MTPKAASCRQVWLRFALGSTLILASCSQSQILVNLPGPEDELRFDTPVDVWDEAIPLGNGIMGALVWGDGKPLRISLDRSDLWDLRKVPEFYLEEYDFQRMKQWHQQGKTSRLIELYEDPYHRPAPTRIPAGRIELTFAGSQEFEATGLSVLDAVAFVRWREAVQAEVLVHAEEPLGMIRIQAEDPPGLRLLAPPFAGEVRDPAQGGIGAGDLAQLGYPAPVETSGTDWRAYTQQGAEGFSFAVFVGWRTRPGQWQAAWSVASSLESSDPLVTAKQRVGAALNTGFESMRSSHRRWWSQYWEKSSVQLPNPILERQWFLEQYKFGSAARPGTPPISLQAVWTADNGKLPPWKGDYHHDLNTQLSYWPCYSGNRLAEGLGYLDWLWRTRETAFEWTGRFFKMPGLNVPMTADLNGRQIGGWRQYTHSATTAAWLAHHFYLHWKFSGDRLFLEERAYPYLKDASVFLEAFTSEKGPDGLRTFPLSSSPEINDNRPEAWFESVTNYDLALARWLFSATAELGEELGRAREALQWRQVLSELPELRISPDGELLVAKDYPLPESHRHFSHLMALHPLGLLDWSDGQEARGIITASLDRLRRTGTDRWTGYSFSWYANLLARALQGEEAEEALEIFATAFTLRNSFHCNGDQSGLGYSEFTYRPFTLEGNFAAAAAIQEMLLQSHRGRIVVFPAVPESWRDVAFTTLRAQGAFLVSARRSDGLTRRVEIVSEKGGICRLVSPFSGEELTFPTEPGERILLKRD